MGSDEVTVFQISSDKPKLEEPKKYKIILHNDDFTPMNFVVDVIIRFFHKSEHEASVIMLKIHNEGHGVCGIFPYEIAKMKRHSVQKEATAFKYPLQVSMEKVQ